MAAVRIGGAGCPSITCLNVYFPSSLCIVNDELFVMEARPKNTQSAFSIPEPTPSTSSVATLSEEQQQMVQAFSAQSGMNCQWSQK